MGTGSDGCKTRPIPSGRRHAAAALLVSLGLLAVTLTAPASALAGVKPGRYTGNSTRGANEAVSFKVKKSKKKKIKKTKKKIKKAKRMLKKAKKGQGGKKAKKKAKRKVRKAEQKLKKAKRPKLKSFRVENVVMFCVERPFPGEPGRTIPSTIRMTVPRGKLFDSKNATKVKPDGSFSLPLKSGQHLDEAQDVRIRGKLSGRSAEGTFLVKYDTYGGFGPGGSSATLECRSGAYPPYGPIVYQAPLPVDWEAARAD